MSSNISPDNTGNTKPRIAIVGLGRMGRPMAAHLISAGYTVTGYDPDAEAVRVAAEIGVAVAPDVTTAAAGAAVALVMAGTSHQVRGVVMGEQGLLTNPDPATTVVVSSTISPADARELGDACATRGMRFVDAPVCRGEAGARDADLLWFVGGERSVVKALRPILEVCGNDVFHLGDVGAGMVGKAMNNLLLWAAVIADREAVSLAETFGVNLDQLLAGLRLSSGANQFLNLWGTVDRFPWAHKDLKVVSAMADEAGLSLPLAGVLRELVKPLMIETGCADLISP